MFVIVIKTVKNDTNILHYNCISPQPVDRSHKEKLKQTDGVAEAVGEDHRPEVVFERDFQEAEKERVQKDDDEAAHACLICARLNSAEKARTATIKLVFIFSNHIRLHVGNE